MSTQTACQANGALRTTQLKPLRSRLRLAGAALALLTLLGGCTFTHTLEPKVSLQELPPAQPVPLRVGLYASPELREYVHARIFGPHRYEVPVGARSTELLTQVLPRVFTEVHPAARPGGDAPTQPAVDAVLEPAIDFFDFELGLDSKGRRYGVSYRFNAYDPAGTPVTSFVVEGRSTKELPAFTPVWEHMGPDLEDAARRLVLLAAEPAGPDNPLPTLRRQLDSVRRVAAPSQDRIRADASAIRTEAEQRALYGVPTTPLGLITVRVHLGYTNLPAADVMPWASQLILTDGRTIAGANLTQLRSQLESRSYSGEVAAMAGAPLAIFVVAMENDARFQERQAMEQALAAVTMGAAHLEGSGELEALLHFLPAASTRSFDSATLRLWFAGDGGQRYALDVPVQGIGYAKPVAK